MSEHGDLLSVFGFNQMKVLLGRQLMNAERGHKAKLICGLFSH